MSGLDEQDVPECPKCGNCKEWFLAGYLWLIPPKSRERRKLIYPLVCYNSEMLLKLQLKPMFICNTCHAEFSHYDKIGAKLLYVLNQQFGKDYHTDVNYPELKDRWLKRVD